MRFRTPLLSRQRGAALLLLVALGGLGGALLLMKSFRPSHNEMLREQQTRQKLAAAREALIGYATQYGRLPRPARSALDGTESPLPCETDQDCSGFIPWVTLGIDGADGWGKLLRYSVTPSFTVIPIQAMIVGGNKTIRNRDNKGNFFYQIGQAGCPLAIECPPAVLYSSGKNNPGTSIQGKRLLNLVESNIDERQNDIASNDFISRSYSAEPTTPGGEFDDLVTWVPLQQLYSRMRAARTLK